MEKLYHLACLDINQMFMMLARFFIAGTTIAKFQFFNDPGFFQQFNRTIDSSNGNGAILGNGTQIKLIIRVIIRAFYYLIIVAAVRRTDIFAKDLSKSVSAIPASCALIG